MTVVNDINGKAIDVESALNLMEIEHKADRWQVRAIERDTGKLIVFPHVFDDPDEVAHQFARVCKSPNYRSVDIEVVLD